MRTSLIFLCLLAAAIAATAQCNYLTSFKTDMQGGPSITVKCGNKLFFSAFDPTHGRELWCTDGTAAGTYMVKDIYPGSNSGVTEFYNLTTCDVNGILYFRGNDGLSGTELWRSDGTTAGTYMVKDLYAGNGNSTIGYLTAVGNLLYFTASTGTALWKSNGTAAGTTLVQSFVTVGNLCAFNNKLYFSADANNTGQELWRSSGTTTVLLKDLNGATGASLPCNFHATGDALYFTAATSTGWELWKTTGTAASTVLVKDINPGGANGALDFYSEVKMANIGNTLYFRANDGIHGYQLWRTEGTAASTRRVSNIANGVDAYCTFPVVDGKVLVNNYLGGHFWQYNPVADTTTESAYPSSYYFNTASGKFGFVGNKMFYSGKDTVYGCEVWMADGTAGGNKILQETHLADNWFYYPSQNFNTIFGTLGTNVLFTLARNPTNTDMPLYIYDASAGNTCFTPSIILPVHISNTQAHFIWNRIPNASQYQLQYRKIGTTAWTTITSSHSYCQVTGLKASYNYEYQLSALCNGIWTPWSPLAAYSPTVVPSDYAISILGERSESATIERIYWQKTTQIDKLGFRYRPVGTTTWSTTTSSNGYRQITGLQANKLYEYQVRAYTGGAWTAYDANSRYFVTSGTYNLRTMEEEPMQPEETIDVYPNPTTGIIHVTGIDDNIYAEVMDQMGRIVKKTELHDGQLDISDLPAGMYILSVRTGEQTVVRKLMKQ